MNEAKSATKYIKNVSFPKTYLLIAIDILLPMCFSIIFSDIIFLILFGIPSVISILIVTYISEIKLRFGAIINLIATIFECIILSIGIIFKEVFVSLAIAFAFTYIFRTIFFRVLGMSMTKALTLSSIRLFIAFILFSLFKIGDIKYVWERILLMVLLFSFLILSFIELVSQPFKKAVNINPFDILFPFFDDWIHGTNKIEDALLKISENGKAQIHVIKFFKENTNEETTLIIPYIHPGPFGNIGSSNMPEIFHKNIKNSLCFHGSCTHELNLIKSQDLYAIVEDINEAHYNKNKCLARFINEGKMSIMEINDKKFVIYDGDGDIDIGIGFATCDAFIDMHSSGEDNFYILPSSLEGMNIIENAKYLSSKLKNIEFTNLKVGTSSGNINYFKNGKINSIDVKILYLEANKKFLFILFDCNNMENRELLASLNLKDINVFPCTTDSHNKENGKFVFKLQSDDLQEISELIKKAIDNAGYVSVDIKKIEKNLKMFGKAAEIMPTANFAVVTLKFLLPFLIFIASFFIIFAIIMWD